MHKILIAAALVLSVGACDYFTPEAKPEPTDGQRTAVADCGARFASMAVETEEAGDLAAQERYEGLAFQAIIMVGSEAIVEAIAPVSYQKVIKPTEFDEALAACEKAFAEVAKQDQ